MLEQHPDMALKGRERKRAADRVAQRDHRRRQKERVEALEAELEFVKRTSCSEQVATLLAENSALREKVRPEINRALVNSLTIGIFSCITSKLFTAALRAWPICIGRFLKETLTAIEHTATRRWTPLPPTKSYRP